MNILPHDCFKADSAQLTVVWELVDESKNIGKFLAVLVGQDGRYTGIFNLGVGIVHLDEADRVVALCDFAHSHFKELGDLGPWLEEC